MSDERKHAERLREFMRGLNEREDLDLSPLDAAADALEEVAALRERLSGQALVIDAAEAALAEERAGVAVLRAAIDEWVVAQDTLESHRPDITAADVRVVIAAHEHARAALATDAGRAVVDDRRAHRPEEGRMKRTSKPPKRVWVAMAEVVVTSEVALTVDTGAVYDTAIAAKIDRERHGGRVYEYRLVTNRKAVRRGR